MTAAGYPKLRYRTMGDHLYEMTVQAAFHDPHVPVGWVQRYGSLPSCQKWRARGNWPGAAETRSRQSRGDAGADLWSAWNARQRDAAQAKPRASAARALNAAAREIAAEVGSDG